MNMNNRTTTSSLRKDVSLEADIGPPFEFASFPKGMDTSQLDVLYNQFKQCKTCAHRHQAKEKQQSTLQRQPKPEPVPRSTIANDCIKGPIPRVSPLSSGLSYRSLPKAKCDDIINVCHHYLEKCKGKYSEQTRAFRMMTEMANEIIELTQTIQQDFEKEYFSQREKINHLNTVCEEWNKHFGRIDKEGRSDKYNTMTPSEIRGIIDKLEDDLRIRDELLKEERLKHFEQERKLHNMINEHHQATRKSLMGMMKQTTSHQFHTVSPTKTATHQASSFQHTEPSTEYNNPLLEQLLEENRILKKKVQELDKTDSSTSSNSSSILYNNYFN